MELDNGIAQSQVIPGRKKLMTTLESKSENAISAMGPIIRQFQEDFGILYACADMGSKRYSLEPSITMNIHFAEFKDGLIKKRVFCLGTASFDIPEDKKLSPEEIKEYNKMIADENDAPSEEDDSDSSGGWSEIDEL